MKPLAKTKGQHPKWHVNRKIERAGEKLGIRLPAEYAPQAALEMPKIKKREWQWFLLTEGAYPKKDVK